MRLLLVNDNGEVVGSIDNAEEYDLNKTAAAADLINNIRDLIRKEEARKITAIHQEQDRYRD